MKRNLLLYALIFGTYLSRSGNGPSLPKMLNEKDVFGTRVFIENRGQYDKQIPGHDKIHYVLDNGLEKIYFTERGVVYQLAKVLPLTERQREHIEKGHGDRIKQPELFYINMSWVNANPVISVESAEKQQHYFTYGSAEFNSSCFKKITYKNVYDKIDIEYTIPKDKDHGVKYNVIIHPGADPAQVKLAYTGDVSKIKTDEEGNIIIKTPLWDITEHFPQSFYQDKEPVASAFNLNENVIGFSFPNNFSHDRTLVIDPWVTTITSLSSNNYAYDVDYDFSGNTYVYGGYSPFKVSRYSSGGVLQWTFAGTVTTPAWTSAPITSQASNFAVNKFNSKTYIGQGYVTNGNKVIRLDALGNYDNFVNAANGQFQEVWDMGFHCTTGEVFVLGGGVSSNISAVTINPTTAVINLTTFQPTNTNIAQDVVSHAIDDAGNIFVNYAGGSLTNMICRVNSTFNGNLWTLLSGFTVFTEQGNKTQYQGSPSLSSNGFNCLAVNANFLFYFDGFNLAAYDKTAGAQVASTSISSLTLKQQGGIAVDDCNNLYLGGNGSILTYNFNGTSFTALTPMALNVTTTNQYVYDIKLDKQSKILYVAGSGFVGVYSPVNTLTCPTATSACFFSVPQDFIICAGQSVTLTASNTTSLGGATFSIQPGGTTNTSGNFTVSPLSTTVYTVFITGTNQANVVVTNSAVSTVSVFPQPSVAPTFTQSSCTSSLNAFNLNLTFNPPSPVPGYTISWVPLPNGITTNSQTSASGGIAPGTYSANITTAWGCSASAVFNMDPIPLPPVFNITPPGGNYLITCLQPSIEITLNPPTNNYTCTNGVSAQIIGSSAVFTPTNAFGNWTVIAQHPTSGCISTQTFAINVNTVVPGSTVTPLFQNITCTLTSVSLVTAFSNPTINITHSWIAPQGATLTANTASAGFLPGGPGIYTHCITNDANGCSTCKTFTVTSSSGFPTYSVSSPQNFTLGCNSKSMAVISIDGADTSPIGGGPVSYTIIGPPTSTFVPTGTLSTQSVYSVTAPGTWTIITKDNTNFCETRVQQSVLQNTFSPQISAIVPQHILTCYTPSIILEGQSTTPNVSYNWSFPGNPGNVNGNTVSVVSNSAASTNTALANYTLTIVDNNNTCVSSTVVPMLQNLFKPNAVIVGGNQITCNTATVVLTNFSNSNIPPVFGPLAAPVIALLWEGPTPQVPLQVTTTYVGSMPGTYTMTAKDLNNGCIAIATKTVDDFRDYPNVNRPEAPEAFVLDCGVPSRTISPVLSNASTTGFTYSWTTVPGASVSGVNTPVLTTNLIGRYQIDVINNLNGCASVGFVDVIDGKLNGEFLADPVIGFAPLTVTFTNNSSSTTGNANITSYWSFGNGSSQVTPSTGVSPVTVYSVPGKYTVKMFINKGSCLDTVMKEITVDIPSQLVIPNIFSPNGDHVNDLFFVKASNLETIAITIYDRWGHKVYALNSTTGNIEWDGRNQYGKDSAEGVYQYMLTAMGKDGKEFKHSGNITLVR